MREGGLRKGWSEGDRGREQAGGGRSEEGKEQWSEEGKLQARYPGEGTGQYTVIKTNHNLDLPLRLRYYK